MAGLLTALGGAVAGVGQGLVSQAEEDGKAKREARLMELQHGYAMERQKDSQQFQTAERVDGQVYQTQRDATKFGQDKELKGIQHGYDVDLEGQRAGSTQANTRLSSELQGLRDTANADRTAKRDERLHGYDQDNEELKSRNKRQEAEHLTSMKAAFGGLTESQKNVLEGLKIAYGSDTEAIRRALLGMKDPALRDLAAGGAEPAAPDASKKPGFMERVFGGGASSAAPAAQQPQTSPNPVAQTAAPTPAAPQANSASSVARPSTTEEFNALPKGALFINPADGKTYRKS